MDPKRIVDWLLNATGTLEPMELVEASVHLPPRSSKWVAVYTGVEPGTQVWKSTGLTDRDAALAQARQWEAAARKERQLLGNRPRRAVLRVGRSSPVSGGSGPLSQREVAALLNLNIRSVRTIEKRELSKLRNHPLLRDLWDEIKTETLETLTASLTREEIAALYNLAQRPEEQLVLERLLTLLPDHPRNRQST